MKTTESSSRIFLLFLILGLGVFSNSFFNKFVLDDFHVIVDNGLIKSLKYIPYYFKGGFSTVPTLFKMYRPLLMLTFNLNYFLHKYWVPGYHIFNILIHILNTYLLYLIISRIFKNSSLSVRIATGLIFLVHPINVEAVSYISSRSDLLVTFFILLSFLNLLRGEDTSERRYLFISYLYLTLAFLTKESALAGLVFYFFYFLGRKNLKLRSFFPCLVLGSGYLLLRFLLDGDFFHFPLIRNYWINTLSQAKALFFYLRLFLFPQPLSIEHPGILVKEAKDAWGLISFFFILIFWGWFFFNRRSSFYKVGLGWYFSFLLPGFIIQLNYIAAEHHFYLPSIGLYLLLVPIFESLRLKIKKISKYLGMALISILILLSIFRNFDWRDEFFLWRKELEANPHSPLALYGLASYYRGKGFYERALVNYKKVLSLEPKGLLALKSQIYIAELYRLQGDIERARKWINQENNLKWGFYLTYHELGLIAMDEDKLEEAEGYFRKELEMVPDYDQVYYNLGIIALRKKQLSRAKEFLQKAVESNPALGEAHYYLGLLYLNSEETDKAFKHLNQAEELNPMLKGKAKEIFR